MPRRCEGEPPGWRLAGAAAGGAASRARYEPGWLPRRTVPRGEPQRQDAAEKLAKAGCRSTAAADPSASERGPRTMWGVAWRCGRQDAGGVLARSQRSAAGGVWWLEVSPRVRCKAVRVFAGGVLSLEGGLRLSAPEIFYKGSK